MLEIRHSNSRVQSKIHFVSSAINLFLSALESIEERYERKKRQKADSKQVCFGCAWAGCSYFSSGHNIKM